MALTTSRPTELWIYGEMGVSYQSDEAAVALIRVNTAPLDIAVAAFMLSHAAFTRGLIYQYGYDYMDASGQWAYHTDSSVKRLDLMRKTLGATERDIVLPGPFIGDKAIHQPIEWVQEQLDAVAANLN